MLRQGMQCEQQKLTVRRQIRTAKETTLKLETRLCGKESGLKQIKLLIIRMKRHLALHIIMPYICTLHS